MELLRQYQIMTIWLVLLGLTILIYTRVCSAYTPEELEWKSATATWYGSPEGDGSTGGACGYGDLVERAPFKSKAVAASNTLWNGGKSCGACYKVRCMETGICTGKSVPLIITDQCPGCSSSGVLLDLSGSAFGLMATPGNATELRNRGRLSILYARIACNYSGEPMTFEVNDGSSEYYFSILIKYKDADGDIEAVQLKQGGSGTWMDMSHLWGANWALTGAGPLKGPFSLKVTSLTNKKTMYAMDVIPNNWQASTSYTSKVQF